MSLPQLVPLLYYNSCFLWCESVFYSSDLNAKGCIYQAFEMYRLKSCVDFKPYEGEDNYIKFVKRGGYGSGCLTISQGHSGSIPWIFLYCSSECWASRPKFNWAVTLTQDNLFSNILLIENLTPLINLSSVIVVSPVLETSRMARFSPWGLAVTTRRWLNMSYFTLWDFTMNSLVQTGMTMLTSGWIRSYQVFFGPWSINFFYSQLVF